MDEEIINLPNQNQIQSKKQFPQQKVLFIGLFIFSMLVILLLFLNYFNIVKLSENFPNYLGFLPHKIYEEFQDKKPTSARQGSPTPDLSSLSESARQKLTAYLPTILDSSLLATSSSDINLREDTGIKDSVSGTWDTKDGKAITILTVSPDRKEISQLLIFLPYTTAISVSTEFAQSTIPKLFTITPKGKWACSTIPNTANYCENFWEEQDGIRRGVALKESLPLSQAKKITFSFCEHSQKSILYSWKSCKVEFAQTGVQ